MRARPPPRRRDPGPRGGVRSGSCGTHVPGRAWRSFRGCRREQRVRSPGPAGGLRAADGLSGPRRSRSRRSAVCVFGAWMSLRCPAPSRVCGSWCLELPVPWATRFSDLLVPQAPQFPEFPGSPGSRCRDFADPWPWRGENEAGMSSAYRNTTEPDLNSPEPPGPFHSERLFDTTKCLIIFFFFWQKVKVFLC